MTRRIVIVGGPHVGKTTLAKRLRDECGVTNTHHSDDVKHLGWSESSATVSEWFNESGEWIIEGVQTARALRKWLAANPDAGLNVDVVILDKPFGELLKGQQSMAKGVHTVFSEIETEIIERGARVHKLKDPNDAIDMFRIPGANKTNPEESGKQENRSSMLKSTYKTLDEIPEGDRPHYKKIGDRYVLELDGDHPVQVQVTTITEEKRTELAKVRQQAATAEAEAERLKQAAANQPTLPSGHVAVAADEAKLLESVKALGKPEEIKTKLEQLDTLTTENAQMKKMEQLRQVADSGIGGRKLILPRVELVDKANTGLVYEEREVSVTVDGKTTTQKAWHVKDGNKWIPYAEYPPVKELGSAMFAEESSGGGTKVPGQGPDDKDKKKPDLYSKIRKDAEDRQKKVKEESIPLEKRLGLAAA